MIKEQEILNPNSCLNRALNGEPLFVLRANDETAPDLVTVWAIKYMNSKGGWERMSAAQQQKFSEALNCAHQMKEWRKAVRFDEDIPF